jgi:ferric-dicitrate binding protein FerR (iron transport regulator)
MSEDHRPPASYVSPEITDARIARQWAAIEQRGLPAPLALGRLRWRFALLALPVVLAFTLWNGLGLRHAPTHGSLIESAEEPITVRLRDGSSVTLDAQTRLKLVRDQDSAVELELGEGRVRFEVTHVRGRSFTVAAGPALVSVVGTQLDVARLVRPEGTLVQVAVRRGVVEVRRRDQDGSVRRLSAGEEWSALLPRADAPKGLALPIPAPEEPVAQVAAPTPPAAAEAEPPTDDVLPGVDTLQEPSAPSRLANARAIFARANVARRAGQLQQAAAAYLALLRHYPRDARAGICAFELGRIRMDALSDPGGAIEAFTQALRLSPRAGFCEDALARIVMAHDTLGQRPACQKARAHYLSAYPQGVHALALAVRCGGR